MTILMQFCGLPLVHALGWTLLHFCWQGTAIAVALWCVLRLQQGGSSQLRYGISCVALVLMVLVPLVTLGYIVSRQGDVRTAISLNVVDAVGALRVGLGDPGAPWTERVLEVLDVSAPWVPLIWLAGMIVFVVRLNAGFIIARRIRVIGTREAPLELQAMFSDLCERLSVTRPVRLMNSALVNVPTVVGWISPVVLVPVSCFTGLSPDQMEAILSHELAHIRRHDYLVSVFQSIVEALLFYHPAVWWVSKQMRLERECCCDELAVGVGGDVLAYAKALSYLEERRSYLPEVALGANGGVLTMRIRRLIGCAERSAISQLAAAMILTIVVGAAAASIGSIALAQSGKARPTESARLVSSGQATAVSGAPMQVAQVDGPSAVSPAPVVVAAAPHEPVRVSGGVMAGNNLTKVDPVYPEDAKSERVQGTVVLLAIISKTGVVEKLQVVSGPNMLRASSIDAVRQWTYKPYLLNGNPVEVQTTITVNYSLGPETSKTAPVELGQVSPASESGMAPLKVRAGVLAGNVISKVTPVYPPDAKAAHIEGAVVLRAVISKTGIVENLQVVSGPKELMRSALDAVRQWVYKPYLLNGQPTEVETTITVNYSLGGSPEPQGTGSSSSERDLLDGVVPRRVGDGVSAPVLISSVNPEFSDQARKDKVSGVVVVNFWVDEQGKTTHVRVVRGVGHGLDEKAVEAVKEYRFKPGMAEGKPVIVALNTEVQFAMF